MDFWQQTKTCCHSWLETIDVLVKVNGSCRAGRSSSAGPRSVLVIRRHTGMTHCTWLFSCRVQSSFKLADSYSLFVCLQSYTWILKTTNIHCNFPDRFQWPGSSCKLICFCIICISRLSRVRIQWRTKWGGTKRRLEESYTHGVSEVEAVHRRKEKGWPRTDNQQVCLDERGANRDGHIYACAIVYWHTIPHICKCTVAHQYQLVAECFTVSRDTQLDIGNSAFQKGSQSWKPIAHLHVCTPA